MAYDVNQKVQVLVAVLIGEPSWGFFFLDPVMHYFQQNKQLSSA